MWDNGVTILPYSTQVYLSVVINVLKLYNAFTFYNHLFVNTYLLVFINYIMLNLRNINRGTIILWYHTYVKSSTKILKKIITHTSDNIVIIPIISNGLHENAIANISTPLWSPII